MTDNDSTRSEYIAAVKSVIASLKQSGSARNSVSADKIQRLKDLAKDYPNDDAISNLLEQLETAEREALERASKSIDLRQHDVKAYSEEERAFLINKENDYFERSKERHELLDKFLSLEHSIESFAITEITQLYHEVVQENDERKASTELISYDLSSFSQATKLGRALNEEERQREREAKDRLHRVLKEELFTAIVSNHVEIYAKETGRRTEDVTLDEVILARGDKVLKEFREAIPTVIGAFRASNEKLAALMFHNPEAIKEHSGNIENLRDAAERAHVKQMTFEEKKIKENREKKAETKESKRDIKKLKVTGRKKLSQEDSLLAKRKAKKTATGSILPPPKRIDISAMVDSSGVTAPKPARDVKSSAQSVSKDRLK